MRHDRRPPPPRRPRALRPIPRFALLALSLLSACAAPPRACPPGADRQTLDTLYFGTAGAAGTVTAEQWHAFLKGSVTPRFAAGLTTWDAAGQWRNRSGAIERENTFVLQIVHPATADSDTALREIMAEYRARFRQEAVLRVSTEVCAAY